MSFSFYKIVFLALTIPMFAKPCVSPAMPERKEKDIWTFDGGVLLITDGAIPDGPCFRVSGRMTAPGFFDGLKRINDDTGTHYRRGTETATQFPDKLFLSFVVFDMPCPEQLKLRSTGPRRYLTRAIVESLCLTLYWKRGIALRPAGEVEQLHFSVEPLMPYATSLANELPERFSWSYEFAVPSVKVPITDRLVLVFRGADGHIVARTAARL